VIRYHVEVYTANEPGADTDANVYLTLFGGLGDTGKRLLQDSNKPDKFQQGQAGVIRQFYIRAFIVLHSLAFNIFEVMPKRF
jgi:hypothetical protein